MGILTLYSSSAANPISPFVYAPLAYIRPPKADQYHGQYLPSLYRRINAVATNTGQWRMRRWSKKIRRDRNMGSNLRRLRDQYGISQEKLCAELQRRGCDIGRTAYAKYESGELNIRASVLIELRKIYSCSYDEFFAGLDRNIE